MAETASPKHFARTLTACAKLSANPTQIALMATAAAIVRQAQRIRRDIGGDTRVYVDDAWHVYCVHRNNPRYDTLAHDKPHWLIGTYSRATAHDIADDLAHEAKLRSQTPINGHYGMLTP